jgi:hypothetical protein
MGTVNKREGNLVMLKKPEAIDRNVDVMSGPVKTDFKFHF